jgi:hypothetical protein
MKKTLITLSIDSIARRSMIITGDEHGIYQQYDLVHEHAQSHEAAIGDALELVRSRFVGDAPAAGEAVPIEIPRLPLRRRPEGRP